MYSIFQLRASNFQPHETIIDFYGQCNDIQCAMNVFKSIPMKTRNVVCVGAMMKSFVIIITINKHCLFIIKSLLSNDTTHLLVLKACMNISDFKHSKC